MLTYRWKAKIPFKAKAQDVGEHLEQLRERNGYLTASLVVQDAKDTDSPTRICFEWDDREAAVQYRLDQARLVLRGIVIVIKDEDEVEPDKLIRAFVYIEDEEDTGHYQSLHVAMSDKDMRNKLLRRALDDARVWSQRYEDLKELAMIHVAIKRAQEEVIS